MLKTNIFKLIILVCFFSCQEQSDALFQLKTDTGINFNNAIEENDSMNILELEYFYRGGGVAIGDMNNDQLPDVLLGGNMVPSRLYLNKGNLQFEDVTEKAGLLTKRWVNGISLVDINQDGLMDIYLCVGGSNNPNLRKNHFFIQQASKNGIPTFKDEAKQMGLDVNKSTTQAAFFDHDLDGDLDVILINTDPDSKNPNVVRPKTTDGTANNTDLFFENRLNEAGYQKFIDISQQMGVLYDGFSLGVSVTDINMDGWPDIYIANDHLSNDILYINQQGKSFVNQANKALKTQSYFSMGVFSKDMDNNGLNDIFTLDMLPETYDRRQRMMMAMNLSRFQLTKMYGYQPQFMKNTLQTNIGTNDGGEAQFAEAAQFAGIHATDWSWGSAVADFNMDGNNDIIITNGYARNITDMDFVTYQTNQNFFKSEINNADHREAIKQQPPITLHNYAFKNQGNLSFADVSKEWGLKGPDLSNGIAYGDLDLDGDLDMVINHIDQVASVYENTASQKDKHYLKVKALDQKGSPVYGTKAFLYVNDTLEQYQELYPVQGYQSTQEATFHFGLGAITSADSLIVLWPDGSSTKSTSLKADTTYFLSIEDGTKERTLLENDSYNGKKLIEPLPLNLKWIHQPAIPYGDMEKQSLLHQTFSKENPPLAVADIDQNGLLDFYVGSGLEQKGIYFRQTAPQVFEKVIFDKGGQFEDYGAAWFDADNDGDLDLYVCSGNTNFWQGHESLQDRLYLQTDKGLIYAKDRLPDLKTFTKSLIPLDFDQDGDLDLLVFGRMVTGLYPSIPDAYLLENENGVFTDKSAAYLPNKGKIAMVSDATKVDLDKDGVNEIILASEWQKIAYLKWDGKKFNLVEIAASPEGWWHSVATADINQDGLMDILCGNAGLNNDYAAHLPLHLYNADVDGDGNPDPLMAWHIKHQNNEKKLLPAFQRDDLMSQFPYLRASYSNYGDFAVSEMADVLKLSKKAPSKAVITDMRSLVLLNRGDGKFERVYLPNEAQLGPITSFLIADFNEDEQIDVICFGNAQNMHVSRCWNSDFYAQVLLNKNGHLKAAKSQDLGVVINNEVRAAHQLGNQYFVTANYADSLRFYAW